MAREIDTNFCECGHEFIDCGPAGVYCGNPRCRVIKRPKDLKWNGPSSDETANQVLGFKNTNEDANIVHVALPVDDPLVQEIIPEYSYTIISPSVVELDQDTVNRYVKQVSKDAQKPLEVVEYAKKNRWTKQELVQLDLFPETVK